MTTTEPSKQKMNTITTTTTTTPGKVPPYQLLSSDYIPLEELVITDPNPVCVPGNSHKSLVESTILPYKVTHPKNRKIPNIIHMTAKYRCMTPKFRDNIQLWRNLPGVSLFLHDDAAVDRLLKYKYWPEFPQLQQLQTCLISGAAKADLWRYLVLWEYGGIYADIDSAPGIHFVSQGKNNRHLVIEDDDDAWFVVERLGILSQYFMAASPKHPFFYLCVTHCLARLLQVDNIGTQYVPHVTGPGVVKAALKLFMKVPLGENQGSGGGDSSSTNNNNHKNTTTNMTDGQRKAAALASFNRVKAGTYVGMGNRSLTVKGSKGHARMYIIREHVSGIHKTGGYVAMGMKHFSQSKNKTFTSSCYEQLYHDSVNNMATAKSTTNISTKRQQQTPPTTT